MNEQDKDGWIEWKGGEIPVDGKCNVDIKMRDNEEIMMMPANLYRWDHKDADGDITSYRINKEQPQSDEKLATDTQIGGDHYKKYGDMQPINILKKYLTPDEFRGYTKGTAIVYLLRESDKNGDEDIAKARHHIQLWEELKGE